MQKLGCLAALSLLACACAPEASPPPATPVTPAASQPAPARTLAATPPTPMQIPPNLSPLGDTDEGMWLTTDFPAERVGKLHGFAPDQPWLDRVRLGSVKIGGGSGSIVSPSGLVMTNHHVASGCIQNLSTKEHDYMQAGFSAAAEKDERPCPGMEIDQLLAITDVTTRVLEATKGLSDRAFNDALKAVNARIEKECATEVRASGRRSEGLTDTDAATTRCDVVSLYQGGRYHLYRYRRFQDVRLVFAPEQPIAFFGGDPDNFMFPRYDFDISFLRLYENGKPAKTESFLKWSKSGVKEGDLTFTSGHPGRTSRLLTMSELVFRRDVEMPARIAYFSELRGLLTEYSSRGKEERRTAQHTLFGVENALKAYGGRREALVDEAFMAKKEQAETMLRAFVNVNAAHKGAAGAWDAIAKSQADARRLFTRYSLLEPRTPLGSDLLGAARTLLRYAEETAKPNEQRLPELTEGKLPAVKARIVAETPMPAGLETVMLTHGLTKLREALTPDDPLVKKLLGKQSPADVAANAVKNTKLGSSKARKALLDGGKAAIDASTDPMIVIARALDPDARSVRKEWEDKVDAVAKKSNEQIAKARFALYGTGVYPDATSSLRISFGTVKGWKEPDHEVKPLTAFAGLYERASNDPAFALPKSWVAAEKTLSKDVSFNVATTNDIIGGNSGSPLLDKNGDVVGLIFDGNIHSLGGDFGYDATDNRAVSLHSAAILEALDKVYHQKRLLSELGR